MNTKSRNHAPAVIACIFFMLGLTAAPAATADIVVVANPASGMDQLAAEHVKKLYLGKTGRFPNGQEAVVIDQKEGSPIRKEFIGKVLGMSPDQIKTYWARKIFSGKGTPPKSLDNGDAVKSFVATTDGAIGYIDSELVDDSVKVVLELR